MATLVGLALVVGAFIALVTVSLTSALVYYVTPSELAAQAPERDVRLYGVVVPGSVQWEASAQNLTFRVTDGATDVAVETQAIPRALFRDGIGVVMLGRPTAPGQFRAEELLIKHSEVYAPLGPGETIPPGMLDALRRGQAAP